MRYKIQQMIENCLAILLKLCIARMTVIVKGCFWWKPKPGRCSLNQRNMTLCCHKWNELLTGRKSLTSPFTEIQLILRYHDYPDDPGFISERWESVIQKLCVKCPSAPPPFSRQRSAVKKTSSQTHGQYVRCSLKGETYADSERWLETMRRNV